MSEEGNGPLAMFLHGVGGNRRNWDLNLGAFAKCFRAVAWDARGYGDSEDLPGPRRMKDFCDDLERVIDFFGADSAHLIGLSMGGRIAAMLYDRAPGRVRSLVLCDTHLGFGRLSDVDRARFLAPRRGSILEGKTPADIAPAIAETLIGDPNDNITMAALIDSLERLRSESYLKTLEASVDDDLGERLDDVTVPTLVLCGERDRITPPKLAKMIARKIEGSHLAIIEGAGHLPNIERSEAFNDAVLGFLKKVEGF